MKNYRQILLPLFMSLALEAHAQELNSVVVKSDVSINHQFLMDRLSPLMGQEIDVTLLNRLLNEISAFYKNQGFPGAQAFFPEQTSSDGILEVYVDTAKLNEIVISDRSGTSRGTLYTLLSKARSLQGRNINTKELSGALTRVRDLNVYDISGYFERLSPDDDENLVNLNLDIRQKKRFGFEMLYDNYGTKASGYHRASAVLRGRNLTGHADSAAFSASVSDRGQSSFILNYEIPVSTHPTVFGTRLSYGSYDLKDEYEALGAEGTAFTFTGYLREPLFRDTDCRIDMTGSVYFKCLEDRLKAYSVSFKKFDYGLSDELMIENHYGSFDFEHAASINVGHIKNHNSVSYQKDRTFFIGSLSSSVQYRFSDSFYVKNSLSLQYANQVLDSSDKFSPVGAYAVGAFDSNIASSDSGIYDDLRAGALFSVKNARLNSYLSFAQAHAKNRSGDKESFYAVSLGLEGSLSDFFANASVNRAVGSNREYAKDELKLLVRFGYRFA